MNLKKPIALLFAAALVLTLASEAHAACMNKYVSRNEGARRIFTLLTGKLTYQEAVALAKAIDEKKSPPIEWLDGEKTIARQLGELKVVRPMPVGCDGKASGVVVSATFMTMALPGDKLQIRFEPETVVTFEKQ